MQDTPLQDTPTARPEPPLGTSHSERARDRKRRQLELLFAALAFLVVLILTSVQLDQFRSGEALFVVMFNVNFVLLLGILLVVLRNGVKLLLERRRKVLGSRLRTRLVLAFVGLSLLPCSLMFLVTTKYVQLSMDFWFKDQVETSMETALDVARSVIDKTGAYLAFKAEGIEAEVNAKRIAWNGKELDALLERRRKAERLSLVGLISPEKDLLAWRAMPGLDGAWLDARDEMDWDTAQSHGFACAIGVGTLSDYIFTAYALENGGRGYLVLAQDMGQGFKARMDRIVLGAGEYKSLRKIKKPLKLMLYSSLGVLTTLIILGAIWFGFRVSRELTAPVLALAAGTERIAKGDLSVRLADSSTDELGMLIQSFNRMASDLEDTRREITDANSRLENQNLNIARHSKYMETVLDNIAAGVVSFDASGIINTANRAACEMLGMGPELLVGGHIESLIPESYIKMIRVLRDRFRGQADSRMQQSLRVTIRGEERHLLVNVVGFATEGVYRGSVAVFEDISELERMQRMAAWREVARRIAHEIKNPLTPIKLSAQRLARKFGGQVKDPAFAQGTTLIVRQVEYLQSMVEEFSAFAKLPEVVPQPGAIEPLLQGITDLFRNSHSGIRWELSIPAALPRLPMDKDALYRAFMNIYTNAAEVLTQAGTPEPFVRITAAYQPSLNLVRVDVEDNGPGLTEEERSRLFEPYFSRKKGGTGLGLTIVRSIITDHRGYIRAMNREGGGTVLSMELPLA